MYINEPGHSIWKNLESDKKRKGFEGGIIVIDEGFNSEEHPKLARRLLPPIDHFNCRCNVEIKRYDPIVRVIFNDPATIIYWKDGSKTVVKCGDNDVYDREKGLAMAIAKKYLGNKGNYNNILKKYLKEEEK